MEQYFEDAKETNYFSSSLPNRLEIGNINQAKVSTTSGRYFESRSSPTNPASESFSSHIPSHESKPRRKSESYAYSPGYQSSSQADYHYLPYVHHAPQLNYGSEQLSVPWQNYQQFQNAPYFQLHAATLDKKVVLYKTEMCRTFEETGVCKYGVKCQFAHDPSEIRSIPRHPRYKTEICKTFWQLGNCPYGKRCCFIHTENELRDKPAKQKSDSNSSFTKQADVFGSVDTLLIDEIATEIINSRNSSRSASPPVLSQRRKSIIEDRILNSASVELSANDPEIEMKKVNQAFELFWSNGDSASAPNSEATLIEAGKHSTSKYVLFSKSPGSRAVPITKTDIWSGNSGSSPFLNIPSHPNSENENGGTASKSGSSSRSSSSRQHLLMEMINLLDSQ